jgi:hypothetical protein
LAIFQPSSDHLDGLLDERGILVARRFATLDDEWTVYTRPRLGQDVVDFVLVHPRHGVLVVAVAADGQRPAERVRRERATLVDQFFALPGDARDPGATVRAVVVDPDRSTADARSMLDDSGDPAVSVWGRDALDDQLGGAVLAPPAVVVPAESVRRLHRQLVVHGVTPPPFTIAQLSAEARTVASNPGGARVRGVAGGAGTGKSFALTARAARLAAAGDQVLVLCFNLTLAHRLRRLVGERCAEYGANPALVTCTSFHTLCARIVEDAAAAGIEAAEPARGTWPEKIVAKTEEVLRSGFECRFDAVLVDEGQDFRLQWWNLLRELVLRDGGEMLLTTDPTVDLYGKSSWSSPSTLESAGFTEPWIEMTGSYRMAPELVDATSRFAREFISADALLPVVPVDQEAVVGEVVTGARAWYDIERVADLGPEVGRAVVRLLQESPGLSPRDVVYLCEYHHDGLAAAEVIEAAGYRVHHLYSRDPDERQRRKSRFWPEADAVKGCTVHAFKGWESPAVVLGVGMEQRSRRLAYTGMTRVTSARRDVGGHLVVVSADPRLAEFGRAFQRGAAVTVDS